MTFKFTLVTILMISTPMFSQEFGENLGESVSGPFLIGALIVGYIIYLAGEKSKRDIRREQEENEEKDRKNRIINNRYDDDDDDW